MFKKLFQRPSPVPLQLYGAVVAQSRNPVFFTQFRFEDTPMGRFDTLSLHLFLLSRRLVREDTDVTTSLNQEVFDTYTADIDSALRALGVGDPSVPKRKKKMVRSFYGLIEDFAAPMDNDDLKALSGAVKMRFYPKSKNAVKISKQLAEYILSTATLLDQQSASQILKGKISWLNLDEASQR